MPIALSGNVYNAQNYGIVADGSTDNTSALNSLISQISALGGGYLYLPAATNTYVTNSGITLLQGVKLLGDGIMNFSGMDLPLNTPPPPFWASYGSWLQCKDTVNSAVTIGGHGCGIKGVNFGYAQPTPSATPHTTWTPTTWPYAVSVEHSNVALEDIFVMGGTHGIRWNYTSTSGGGTMCSARNILLHVFKVGIQTNYVNDTMHFDNIHVRNLFYEDNPNVVDYELSNLIGWDCHYTDNIVVNGFEVFHALDALLLTDQGPIQGNTHSLWNASIHGFAANLCRRAIRVAANNTNVRAYFSNFLAQSVSSYTGQTGSTPTDTLIQLGSDNVNVKIANCTIPTANGQLASIGNGLSGEVMIDNLEATYNALTTGQVGIGLSAGSVFHLGARSMIRAGTNPAGPLAGSGLPNVQSAMGIIWQPFAWFSQASYTGTGSIQDLTNDFAVQLLQGRSLIIRISGQLNVTTPQASGTITLTIPNFPEANPSVISASTSGWRAFDTGWVTLSSATNNLGRIRFTATNGVVFQFGDLTVQVV